MNVNDQIKYPTINEFLKYRLEDNDFEMITCRSEKTVQQIDSDNKIVTKRKKKK